MPIALTQYQKPSGVSRLINFTSASDSRDCRWSFTHGRYSTWHARLSEQFGCRGSFMHGRYSTWHARLTQHFGCRWFFMHGGYRWLRYGLKRKQFSSPVYFIYFELWQRKTTTPCLKKKLCQLIFWSLFIKYEPISIKIGRIVQE